MKLLKSVSCFSWLDKFRGSSNLEFFRKFNG